MEDDESIREIEEYALKNAGHDAKGFPDAKTFLACLKKKLPDLILLDIMLPDTGGNELVRLLRCDADTKRVPIIMVTAKTTELDMIRCLEDGADDYIKKPFSVMELITRTKALLRRSEKKNTQTLILDELSVNDQKHEVRLHGQTVELTYKEFCLLTVLLQNKGLVLSRDALMDRVWGVCANVESRTLDAHIKSLRQKLSDYGARIRTIRNVGYTME